MSEEAAEDLFRTPRRGRGRGVKKRANTAVGKKSRRNLFSDADTIKNDKGSNIDSMDYDTLFCTPPDALVPATATATATSTATEPPGRVSKRRKLDHPRRRSSSAKTLELEDFEAADEGEPQPLIQVPIRNKPQERLASFNAKRIKMMKQRRAPRLDHVSHKPSASSLGLLKPSVNFESVPHKFAGLVELFGHVDQKLQFMTSRTVGKRFTLEQLNDSLIMNNLAHLSVAQLQVSLTQLLEVYPGCYDLRSAEVHNPDTGCSQPTVLLTMPGGKPLSRDDLADRPKTFELRLLRYLDRCRADAARGKRLLASKWIEQFEIPCAKIPQERRRPKQAVPIKVQEALALPTLPAIRSANVKSMASPKKSGALAGLQVSSMLHKIRQREMQKQELKGQLEAGKPIANLDILISVVRRIIHRFKSEQRGTLPFAKLQNLVDNRSSATTDSLLLLLARTAPEHFEAHDGEAGGRGSLHCINFRRASGNEVVAVLEAAKAKLSAGV